jgi:hypothetical protein
MSAKLPLITPKIPQRPNTPVYGVDALATVPVFQDREAYKAFTGVQAPPFDPTEPVKRWYVSTGATFMDPFVYSSYNTKNNPPTYESYTLGSTAGLVNLPGHYEYPAYNPAPSGAYYRLNGEKQYLPASNLADIEDVRNLVDELKAWGWPVTGAEELTRTGMYLIAYEPGETRRVFQLHIGTNSHNAGALLMDRSSGGVGAPGTWTKPVTGNESPDWNPAPVNEMAGRNAPEWPVPMRELEPGEQWHVLPFGVQIVNTAHPAGAAEANEQSMADNVAKLVADVAKIKAHFGIV